VLPSSELPAGGSPPEGSLHGRPLLRPYPRLEALEIKRLAARRHNTTYCYDFPSVFENALRDIWCAPLALPRGAPHGVAASPDHRCSVPTARPA
jgi:hypothetical protein